MPNHAAWPNPPGYAASLANMHRPPLGWAVLTPHGTIAVVRVRQWGEAQQSKPYRWLNTHPRQPAAPCETLPLAEETYRHHKRQP